MSDIKNLTMAIRQFIAEREWQPYLNPKDLAISISLEANELLEHFQWKKEADVAKYVAEHKEEISDEIADVFNYIIQMADALDIDLADATLKKLAKSAKKYPVEKIKGNWRKYTELTD